MTSQIIANPAIYRPDILITRIESTPDAFTEGRRNNDIVNWVLANLLLDLVEDREFNQHEQKAIYADRFGCLMQETLSERQRYDLVHWHDDPFRIVRMLCSYYGRRRDPGSLFGLWLPMLYDDGTPANMDKLFEDNAFNTA